MRKLALLSLLFSLPALAALPAYQGVGTVGQSVTSTTITVPCPASPTIGDVQFIYETFDNTASVVTPSGFTAAETGQTSARWYYRVIVTGSETNPTVATGTTVSFQAVCQSWRGINNSSPVNQAVNDTGSSSTSLRVPAITVSGNNQVLLYGGRAAETWTSLATVANFTEIVDSPYTGTAMAVDYWIQSTATNISLGSVAITGGTSSTNIVSIIALNPADPVFNGTISSQTSTEGTSVGSINFSTFFTNVTSYSVQGCTLPHNLSLNTGSGVVTGTPDIPPSVTGCVIRATNSSGTADSNSFSWTINPPTGKQYVTLASLDPTSFCALDFNPVATPDIAVADVLKIDTATSPALFTQNADKSGVLFVGTDCTIFYAGDQTRQKVLYDVYDASVGSYMTGGPGTSWFNNQPPIGAQGQIFYVVPYNTAMTPVDLTDVCTDPENDAQVVTAVDPLPTGLSIVTNILSGTATVKGRTDVRFSCCDITGACTVWQ